MFKTKWQKNIAVILILSIFFFHFFEMQENLIEKNTFNRWGMITQINFGKHTLYVTEKCKKKKKKKKKKITVSFPGKTPLKLIRYPPPPKKKKKKKKNQAISIGNKKA